MPRLTSRFGYRADPIRGGWRMHTGIDIPGPLGTPVRSSAGGFVRFAGNAGGYGQMVEIDHGGGLHTRYAHLSRILVQPGMAVTGGETIALMGSTGHSTGSHLHFEVRSDGRPENPLAYLGGRAARASDRAWSAAPERTAVRLAPLTAATPHVSDFARRRAKMAGEPGAGS
ncbi:M23 family metallopeptidase [Novosphingobium sp. H3SJ31-1]|uniref:M23 family metallopeptidase n=2 Tax=Novosphingobium album (ex Liu et al. 2023) TaxID=3031130 RepID=A0ABT5WQN9_9SPHN|nr:M23 family metallopeptidase [Novosphingobium album (ex Liu et al. 2023)]